MPSSSDEEETQRLRSSPLSTSQSMLGCWQVTKECLRGTVNILSRVKVYLFLFVMIAVATTLYIIFSQSIGMRILFMVSIFLLIGLSCLRQLLLLRYARRHARGSGNMLRTPLGLSRLRNLHMRRERGDDSDEEQQNLRNIDLRRLQLAVSERDFDENDYEALLALDDDNENQQFYSGASRTDINRLPTFKIPISSKKDASCRREQQTSRHNTAEQHYVSIDENYNNNNQNNNQNNNNNRMSNENNEINVTIDQNDIQECGEELKQRMLQQQCSICLDQYEEGDVVITLPCLHQYHRDCVMHWLQMKAICPICKSHVF